MLKLDKCTIFLILSLSPGLISFIFRRQSCHNYVLFYFVKWSNGEWENKNSYHFFNITFVSDKKDKKNLLSFAIYCVFVVNQAQS